MSAQDPQDRTREELRREQLTTAPDATEEDAADRVRVTRTEHGRRVDILDDAPVRPGPGPGMAEAEGDAGR